MYQQKRIIKNTGLCLSHENHLYTCTGTAGKVVVSQYDAHLGLLQSSPEVGLLLCAFTPSSIVFIDNKEKTGLLSKQDLRVTWCDHFLKGLREYSIIPGQEKYIGTIGNDRCGIVDLQRNTIEKIWRNEMQAGFIMALPDGFLEFGQMSTGTNIFYRDYDDRIIWQTDVSEKGQYQKIENKGKWYAPAVAQPVFYKDSVIFTAGSLMTRLELNTGKVLWESTTASKSSWPINMALYEETGYANGGAGYIKIDLENGMSEPVTRFKNFMHDGEEIYPFGKKLMVHDGLLWHAISDGGKNFIAAIDRHTGDYLWKQFIDVYGTIQQPVFFNNYMLLPTDAGETIVMEKTND